jgi:hypothetical protein
VRTNRDECLTVQRPAGTDSPSIVRSGGGPWYNTAMTPADRVHLAALLIAAVLGAVIQDAFGWRRFGVILIGATTVHVVMMAAGRYTRD